MFESSVLGECVKVFGVARCYILVVSLIRRVYLGEYIMKDYIKAILASLSVFFSNGSNPANMQQIGNGEANLLALEENRDEHDLEQIVVDSVVSSDLYHEL